MDRTILTCYATLAPLAPAWNQGTNRTIADKAVIIANINQGRSILNVEAVVAVHVQIRDCEMQ